MQRPATGLVRRRQPVFRVRTGYFTCRSLKKKCDEVSPVCAGCRAQQTGVHLADPWQHTSYQRDRHEAS
jgi:hypothetical protein